MVGATLAVECPGPRIWLRWFVAGFDVVDESKAVGVLLVGYRRRGGRPGENVTVPAVSCTRAACHPASMIARATALP